VVGWYRVVVGGVGGRWGVGRSPEWALVGRGGFEVGVGC